ncbi:MAG: MBL fold metallo-hydrolase [archaeon]|nr:MBL fold metallo-hydrolase [archaeon]
MDKAKVTVLYDEGAMVGTTFIGGQGFSMMIEVDGERTLFGAGRRTRYLSNNLYLAEVDVDSITRVVVSHGHPDHWAALPAVLHDRAEKIDLLAPVTAWGQKKFLGATGMTFSEDNMEKINRIDVGDWVQLSKHLFVTAPIRFHDGGGEEVFMVIDSKNGPVLISGCCHCGVDNVFEAVKERFGSYPVALLGGLHIKKKQDKLADLYAEYLQKAGCRTLYLNHCTGLAGIGRLRVTLGLNGVNDFYVGQSMSFNVL